MFIVQYGIITKVLNTVHGVLFNHIIISNVRKKDSGSRTCSEIRFLAISKATLARESPVDCVGVRSGSMYKLTLAVEVSDITEKQFYLLNEIPYSVPNSDILLLWTKATPGFYEYLDGTLCLDKEDHENVKQPSSTIILFMPC